MLSFLFSILASATLACRIPDTKLSNNITEGFAVQLQNASYPEIHNHYLHLWDNGGGDVPHDQHLYVSPAGNATSELTLVNGVLTLPWSPNRRAVINLEYNEKDNTTKMFMTDRDDPRGIFDVVYGCNADTDALQVELHVKSRGDVEQGGEMGVKPAGTNHDFRWRAPGTTISDSYNVWKKVTMIVVHGGEKRL